MIKIQVKINQADLDRAEQIALDTVAQRAIKGLDNIVGPHLLEVAKARAPVGRRNPEVRGGKKVQGPDSPNRTPINPQRSSFKPLRLAERSEGRFTRDELERLANLRAFSARERAESLRSSDIKFFRGAKRTPNENRTPDQIDVIRGSIRGAFIHKPGTLRDSHVYIPAKRVSENRVEAEVRATAPYAAAQHEGFQHHSHGKKTGTFVKGRKWLVEALGNVTDELNSSATYEG